MTEVKSRDRKQLIQNKLERSKINDTSIQGEIISVMYRNGPISSRSCTDLFGCFFYLIFLGLGIFVTVYALQDGNLKLIENGYDTDSKK